MSAFTYIIFCLISWIRAKTDWTFVLWYRCFVFSRFACSLASSDSLYSICLLINSLWDLFALETLDLVELDLVELDLDELLPPDELPLLLCPALLLELVAFPTIIIKIIPQITQKHRIIFGAMDKHLDTMILYVTCLLIIPNIIRRYRGNIADFFCHTVESNTLCTSDMALTCVMLPWTEDKHLPFGAGIK